MGQQIADLRTKRRIKQDTLADRIKVTRQHMSRLENGHSPIDIVKLRQIAEVLGVSISSVVSVIEPGRPVMTPEHTEMQSVRNQCMLDLDGVEDPGDLDVIKKFIRMMVEKQHGGAS